MGEPSLLVLSPLCHRPTDVEQYLPEWGRTIREHSRDESETNELLALLALFASHRLAKRGVAYLVELIGGFAMQETRVAQELMDIGHEKGLEEGFEKGLVRGHEKGRLEESRRLLRRMVMRRFRDSPDWLEQWMSKQTTAEAVEQAIDLLIDAQELGELKTYLQPPS
jgi:predicted transposase YdaD